MNFHDAEDCERRLVMNREFIEKMVAAKKLEYEALKSIMPERMGACVQKVESEVMETIKEYMMSQWMGNHGGMDAKENKDIKNTTDKSKAHKINIES